VARPLCEPVELAAGARLRLERVAEGSAAPASASFPHFHEVHELVLFGQVEGWLQVEGERWPLRPGCAVWVPSMRIHDYALGPGPRNWLLLQLDPALAAQLRARGGLDGLANPCCRLPGAGGRERLDVLLRWLSAAPPGAPELPALLELLLRTLLAAPASAGEPVAGYRADLERLRPAIEWLRREPADPPGAEAAAAACALSPAWFSRCFKRQVGLSWSDYVRAHRLQLAAQRLLDETRSAASISDSLGFSTPSHFGELFQRRFGMTPAAYRRRFGRAPRG